MAEPSRPAPDLTWAREESRMPGEWWAARDPSGRALGYGRLVVRGFRGPVDVDEHQY